MRPIVSAYGTWSSPFSFDLVTSGTVSLTETRWDGDSVLWIEGRPLEGGRASVVRHDPDGTVGDVTPDDFYTRTRVHEYGGAPYVARDGVLWCVQFADQAVYRVDEDLSTTRVTPKPPRPASVRYADLCLSPDGATIFAVRETHHEGREAINEIISFPADGSAAATTVSSGHDFFSSPRVSPRGDRLAWLAWDHPQMPWDGTELWVAELGRDGEVGEAELVCGGPQESVFQPQWSPSGTLHFVSDRTGWWNLYCWRDGNAVPLAPMEAEFGAPQWVFGMSRYAFLSGDRIASVYSHEGDQRLGIIEPESGRATPVDLPYSSFGETIRSDGVHRLVFVGSSATRFSEVAIFDVESQEIEVCRKSVDLEVKPEDISVARGIEFPTSGDRSAHAFFYPPANASHAAPAEEKPPLLVFSHGGPTGQSGGDLRLGVQFWTSRGFAVVDVNYGGSTGYGREYRERLRGTWGVVDTEDCIHAVKFLEGQGEIDPTRAVIRGGSAGGYTTLCALTFHDVFAAGASYFGVADPVALTKDTHKFESRYLDGLIGPLPEAEGLYRERSPIHHTDRLSCPVILLQGLEDRVVPPSQAEKMIEALAAKGLPHAYLAFEGEQHGFRKAENRRRSLEAEIYFYARVFGFQLADEIEPLEIENLDEPSAV